MNFCIGGELELQPKVWLQEDKYEPANFSDTIYTDTGRSALLLALQAVIQQGGIKKAWLPGYCCSSVLAPFQQLGFEIHFYSMGEDLQTPADLPTDLHKCVFLFIHYFGKRNTVILNWLSTIQKIQECYVIEDCVQASLNDNVGYYGDFSVRSYRKFLPQPDGAVLTYKQPFAYELLEPDEQFISQKVVGKLLRGASNSDQVFLRLFADSEERIGHIIIPRHMSWISGYLLRKSDIAAIKKKRRENWFALHELLYRYGLFGEMLKVIYKQLDDDEIPLGYPVIVKNNLRDELRKYLVSHQIFCPVHWPIDDIQLCTEKKLSSSILTLPIDQRVTIDMLKYMVEKISEFEKRGQ